MARLSVLYLLAICAVGIASDIEEVHIVFMNHLDLGFNTNPPGGPHKGYIKDVLDLYFNRYLIESVKVANEAKKHGYEYIYTTHPFLLWGLLNCGSLGMNVTCPPQEVVDEVLKGVQNGTISYHAFPHNAEAEGYDKGNFLAQFGIISYLETLLNVTKPRVMSQRDVPGTTRAIIPLLKSVGVEALSIGVNGGSTPPTVPKIFKWKAESSEDYLITMLHPYGYGGLTRDDAAMAGGQAIIYDIRTDNGGPHSLAEIIEVFTQLRLEFPNAQVRASTYDQFLDKINNPATLQELPFVDSEIGDTWIHGVMADPLRTTYYYAMMEGRRQYLQSNPNGASGLLNFDIMSGKLMEHTWGVDIQGFLHDTAHYSNVQLREALQKPNFQYSIGSWVEQRMVATSAIHYAPAPLQQLIQAQLDLLTAVVPDPSGYSKVLPNSVVSLGRVQLSIDHMGGLALLKSATTTYVSGGGSLFSFVYQTFAPRNVSTFVDEYWNGVIPDPGFPFDFGKAGMGFAKPPPEYQAVAAEFQAAFINEEGGHLLVHSTLPQSLNNLYGAPLDVWLSLKTNTANSSTIDVAVQYFNKSFTRLVEAGWVALAFNNYETVSVDKMEQTIDITNVVDGGAKHMHVVTNITFGYPTGSLRMTPYNARLVSFTANPFPTPIHESTLTTEGVYFNLFNNVWGTNYPQWYPFVNFDEDSKFKAVFTLHFQ